MWWSKQKISTPDPFPLPEDFRSLCRKYGSEVEFHRLMGMSLSMGVPLPGKTPEETELTLTYYLGSKTMQVLICDLWNDRFAADRGLIFLLHTPEQEPEK